MIQWSARRLGPLTIGDEAGKTRLRMDWKWFVRLFVGGRR
jgi:hypothetical protein